jgi:cell division protein FtsB
VSNKPNYKQPSHLTAVIGSVQKRVYSSRRKVATVAATVLAVFMGYHVVFGANGLTAYEHKREDKRSLELQMQQLQRENDGLLGHVDRLQNDPSAIEHQAREELHYTRAGEVIYTLPADPTPQTDPTASKP